MPAPPAAPPRWLVPVVIVVVSIMVGGGLLARELYRLPEAAPDAILAQTSPARPLAEQPGPGIVELTPDAAAHPQNATVRGLLQTYFDSINNRDYELWKTAVTRERVQAKPKSTWLNDYRTTKDGSILVYRIDPVTDDELRALVGFTSTQDVKDAPAELPEPCVHWRLVLPLALESGAWKVDTVTGSTTPELSRC
ncbi:MULTISPECIES: hypothetical protein [Amycolatopsis]|uniref:Secreted protein n=1 Tax=Amycolatopsis thermalba TaxID=944492 RepID=A0ABY4P2F6_9PSEU|nr:MULTISPECIES: hypothetical protein [Amycolatopsis]UQS26529.1 hypothetical protein L1857_28845 [Amycolatopsis thermalba]